MKSFACALLCWASLLAQDPPANSASTKPAPAQPGQLSPTEPAPLTLKQKYRVALNRSIDPAELVRIALGAGFDQLRDYPDEWGQGWDAFGVRVASGFGQQLVREQIQFGVWAIDHEDPRHRRSGLHGFWPRTRYAIVHTFISRRDDGRYIPAYSRFIGDYGAGFISRQWYPSHFHTVQQGFDAGTVSLGLDVGMNVVREFVPSKFVH